MNKTIDSKSINGSGKTARKSPPTAQGKSGRLLGKSSRKQNPRDTAQEAVHQVMPKAAARSLTTNKDAATPPLRAARGDDDLMSQPAKHS